VKCKKKGLGRKEACPKKKKNFGRAKAPGKPLAVFRKGQRRITNEHERMQNVAKQKRIRGTITVFEKKVFYRGKGFQKEKGGVWGGDRRREQGG